MGLPKFRVIQETQPSVVCETQRVLEVPSVLRAVCCFPPVSYVIRNFGKPIAVLSTCFHAGFLLDLLFDPEDGRDMFLRKVGRISTDYMTLHPRI
jgi:hypothetical protein